MTLHPNTRLMLEIWCELHPDTTRIPDPRQQALRFPEYGTGPSETGNTGD